MSEGNRYEKHECIGRGAFGDVWRGTDKLTGQSVAIKIIDLDTVDDDIEDIHKEVTALANSKSQNITEFYAAVMNPGTTELMIIMELMSCSVGDLIQLGPLDEASIAFVLKEVLQALVYLHSHNRIHRDIKAANVLISSQGSVKISDFGVSGQLTSTMAYRRRTFVGTPYWMAPEVIESSEDGYTERADIWSVGISAYEMAKCQPPHAELHPMRVLFLIPKNPPPSLDGPFSESFKDFVATCLQKEPSRRPSAQELLQHPFIAQAAPVPELAEMAGEYARRRAPLSKRRTSDTDYAGTMPAWDFGTTKRAHSNVGTGTVKAGEGLRAGAGDTLRAAPADRYGQGGTVKAREPVDVTAGTGTVRAQRYWDANGAGSEAADSINGSGSEASSPTRSVAQPPDSPHMANRTSTPPSLTAADLPITAAAATLRSGASPQTLAPPQAQGATRTPLDTGAGPSSTLANSAAEQGTVRAQRPATNQEAAQTTGRAYNHSTALPALAVDGLSPRAGTSDQLGMDAYGTVVRRGSDHSSTTAPYTRRSTQTSDPGTPPSGSAPDRMAPQYDPAESAAVLRKVFAPSLQRLIAPGSDAQHLIQSLAAGLLDMEQQLPGSCSRLLTEIHVALSISDDPALRSVRASAAAALGAAPADPARMARKIPSMGALGEFLLGQWQEDVIRDKAFYARFL